MVSNEAVVTGDRLGRYTLLGKLATGGMAEVFLARQDGPQGFAKTVVIKKILGHLAEDEQFVEMFLNEARLAALINHPNVVSIYELGEDAESGSYYMVMEYIDGCNLKRVAHAAARNHKRIPIEMCAKILADAAAGLDYAHNLKGEAGKPLNIVHRDVSPENILVTYGGQVKVVDFGIAKATVAEGRTRTGQLKGKFGYMAPEQTLGKPLDRRADVWALGVVLYWLCTGQKPFSGDSEGAIIQKILYATPQAPSERNPAVDPEMDRIILTALAKDPAQRYASAHDLQLDLERWAAASGKAVSALALSEFMNAQFPETIDADRLLTRAILSGDFKAQMTPSQTELSASGSRGRTKTNSSSEFDISVSHSRTARIAAISAGSVLLVAIAGGGVWWKVAAEKEEEAVAAAVASAKATAPTNPTPPEQNPTPAPTPPLPPPAGSTAVADLHPAAAEPPPVREREHEGHRYPHHHLTREPARSHPEATSAPAPAPAPPPAPRGPPGKLAVRVLPWAAVYVDGQLAGTTPFEPIPVAAGRHSIRLVNDEIHAERTMSIEIKSGETATLKAKLE